MNEYVTIRVNFRNVILSENFPKDYILHNTFK